MTETTAGDTGAASPSPGARLTPWRQIWLAFGAIGLMGCGLVLALSALKVEDALHLRYDDALALAQKTVALQQAATTWRARRQGSAAQSQATGDAERETLEAVANLAGLAWQLQQSEAGKPLGPHIERFERALDALVQRDRAGLDGTEAAAAVDAALTGLVTAVRERIDRSAQRTHRYASHARIALVAASAAALVLAALLSYVSWRTLHSNARLLEQLNHIAQEDGLTGAINRRGLDARLPVEMARASRVAYPLAVAMIDFDHFKRFNDRRGHPAGDRVLRGAVAAWRAHLRPMDMLVRYGGEEFTLVLPMCDELQACALVERLRPLMPERQTFSAGVAKWNGRDSAEELLRHADEALLQAKRAGRNRTIVWGGEPQVTLPLGAA